MENRRLLAAKTSSFLPQERKISSFLTDDKKLLQIKLVARDSRNPLKRSAESKGMDREQRALADSGLRSVDDKISMTTRLRARHLKKKPLLRTPGRFEGPRSYCEDG